jgi:dihydrofolate reductase
VGRQKIHDLSHSCFHSNSQPSCNFRNNGGRGGTIFHFVTDGIESALKQAKDAAGKKDERLGGVVVAVIRQYLQAELVDEMHLAISPTLLGSGEHFFIGTALSKLDFHCIEQIPTSKATHVVLKK